MRTLDNKRDILYELDTAISDTGQAIYYNCLYGTCMHVNIVRAYDLERTRQRLLLGNTSRYMLDYARELLTKPF